MKMVLINVHLICLDYLLSLSQLTGKVILNSITGAIFMQSVHQQRVRSRKPEPLTFLCIACSFTLSSHIGFLLLEELLCPLELVY